MTDKIQSDTYVAQPPTPNIPNVLKSTTLSKILLPIAAGLVLITGLIFVGILLGKKQAQTQQPIEISERSADPTTSPIDTVFHPTTISSSLSKTSSNWVEYSNTRDNFEIQYPLMYEHRWSENVNSNEISPYAIKYLDKELWTSGESLVSGGVSGDFITIDIYPDSGDEWSDIPSVSPDDETVNLDGQIALKKTNPFTGMTVGPIKYKNLIYKITYTPSSNSKSDFSIFNKMISSFRFIQK